MKICQSCGSPIPEGNKFCSSCGAPVSDSPKKNNNENKNKRIFQVIIATIAIIAVLCIVIPLSLTFAKDIKVKSNTNLGNKYLLEGKYEEAVLSFEKIISIDSKNIPARIGIAKASTAIKNYDKAHKALNEVLEIDKNNSEALKLSFDLYLVQAKEAIVTKKYDAAEEAINKALQLSNKDISIYASIADLYIHQGETNRAVKILELGIMSTKDEKLKSKLDELRKSSRGNTPGNIANGGNVVEKDSLIYISYPFGLDYGVYRIDKNNRASKIKIADTGGYIQYLNIDKEFLYFSSYVDSGQFNVKGKTTIFKVKLNGTNIKTLAEDASYFSHLTLKNNRLYYINNEQNIISMDTEGKNLVKISSDKCGTMSVGDEWIYYSNMNDSIKYTLDNSHAGTLESDMGKIYRVKLDGSGKEKFCEDGTYFIIADSDYIYYENGSDGGELGSEGTFWYSGKLYRLNLDGTNKRKVLDYLTYAANVDENWIYTTDSGLIRINKSSGEEQTISKSLDAFIINLIDNEVLILWWNYNVNTSNYDYKYYETESQGLYGIRLDQPPSSNPSSTPQNNNPVNNSDFIIPYSSERKLTIDDISTLTKDQLGIARNEIYARHGFVFKTDKYKQYFESKSWYIPNDTFNESMLSEVEKYNVEFIKQYE